MIVNKKKKNTLRKNSRSVQKRCRAGSGIVPASGTGTCGTASYIKKMIKGKGFNHSKHFEWLDNWEHTSIDGITDNKSYNSELSHGKHIRYQNFKFNEDRILCALIDSSSSFLFFWDFSIIPIFASHISIPRFCDLSSNQVKCHDIIWSESSEKLILIISPKTKTSNKISFQNFSDVILIDVSKNRVENTFRFKHFSQS